MPSFQDSAFIFFLALLLFGPKKLPELARYVGKLMNEFRRASNEFRSQMEEEFRQAEQVEQQKKIAAIEAAAPVAPIQNIPEPEHPHNEPGLAPESESPALISEPTSELGAPGLSETWDSAAADLNSEPPIPPDRTYPHTHPVPIASSGDLHLMPPATGLPISRSASSKSQPEPVNDPASISGIFDSIPHAPEPDTEPAPETTTHA